MIVNTLFCRLLLGNKHISVSSSNCFFL